MGPEPRIRIFEISVRFGIENQFLVASYLFSDESCFSAAMLDSFPGNSLRQLAIARLTCIPRQPAGPTVTTTFWSSNPHALKITRYFPGARSEAKRPAWSVAR